MAQFMNALPKDQEPEAASVKPAALKLRESCQYLGGISQITLRRLISRGLIKPNRALRHILIPIAELDRFLAK